MDVQQKVKLSKTILDMKFMKRTKERVTKEAEDAESQAMYSSEITDEMRKGENIIFIETSILNCKDLIEGRLSFGNMNPEIEKLMPSDYGKKLDDLEKRKEKDISDIEMAKEHSTLINTIGQKFESKRNRNKKKFMKPQDQSFL